MGDKLSKSDKLQISRLPPCIFPHSWIYFGPLYFIGSASNYNNRWIQVVYPSSGTHHSGHTKWEPIQLLVPWRVITLKQGKLPVGHNKIIATFGELEKAGVTVPAQSSFSSPVWTIKKCNGTWPMTIDYRELYKVTQPIHATVPSIVLLLEKIMASIKTSLYTGPI